MATPVLVVLDKEEEMNPLTAAIVLSAFMLLHDYWLWTLAFTPAVAFGWLVLLPLGMELYRRGG